MKTHHNKADLAAAADAVYLLPVSATASAVTTVCLYPVSATAAGPQRTQPPPLPFVCYLHPPRHSCRCRHNLSVTCICRCSRGRRPGRQRRVSISRLLPIAARRPPLLSPQCVCFLSQAQPQPSWQRVCYRHPLPPSPPPSTPRGPCLSVTSVCRCRHSSVSVTGIRHQSRVSATCIYRRQPSLLLLLLLLLPPPPCVC